MTIKSENPCLQAALAYSALGWRVFPVDPAALGHPETGKRPLAALVSRGKDDATTDPETIRAWWSFFPSASVGIACDSSNLVVLDVDVASGKRGAESLEMIRAELPPTMAARTGSGGWHLYYRGSLGEAIHRLAALPGIDVIGSGYVVAPPSPHHSGGRYEWIEPRAPLAPVPAVIRRIAGARAPTAVTVDSAFEPRPIVQGERNDAMFKLACALRSQGIGERALLSALLHENRERFSPPLPDEEVAQVAASALTRASVQRDAAANEAFRAVVAPTASPQVDGLVLAGDVCDRNPIPVRVYPTGIAQLDTLLGGGLSTRQLLALLGKPGAGKSAFVMFVQLILEARIPVLYASTELEDEEIVARLASPVIGTPWREILRASDGELRAKARAAVRHRRIGVIGCDRLPMGIDAAIAKILADAIEMRERFGTPAAIVVDYLQDLVRGAEDGVRHRVGAAARSLRVLSQAADCPVIAVSSVSRSSYGANASVLRQLDDATAYLPMAKESGDVDYAAATVIFLDVDDEVIDGRRMARAAVAKCRHGQTGFAGLSFDGATGRWDEKPEAVQELSSDRRGEKRRAEEESRLEAKILDHVRKLKQGGIKHLKTKRALQDSFEGVGKARVGLAVDRMIASGVLVLVEDYGANMHRIERVDLACGNDGDGSNV